MSTTKVPAAELHLIPQPWTASITLARLPVCPRCGHILPTADVVVVAGVAYCGACAHSPAWYLLRDAQFLRTPQCQRNVISVAGIVWYTPRYPGPPTATELSHELGCFDLLITLPVSPAGNTIPPPRGYSALALLNEMYDYRHKPAEHAPPRTPRFD